MTEPAQRPPIIVGIDGSAPAQDALAWGAVEAASMRAPLHIVHCVRQPATKLAVGSGELLRPQRMDDLASYRTGGWSADGDIWVGQRVLAEAEVFARRAARDIDVTSELLFTNPAQALLDKAHQAELVVVGSRGLGGFAGLVMGSVSTALTSHASCPVVVVPPHPTPEPTTCPSSRRVVVGVDGSEHCAAAISFAFHAAARRGVGVTAIHAWATHATAHPARMEPAERVQSNARHLLTESLEAERHNFPDLDVQPKLARARPSQLLIAESADAELVVVGSRGHVGLRGLVRGSVSQSVLHHTHCPVAVIGPRR